MNPKGDNRKRSSSSPAGTPSTSVGSKKNRQGMVQSAGNVKVALQFDSEESEDENSMDTVDVGEQMVEKFTKLCDDNLENLLKSGSNEQKEMLKSMSSLLKLMMPIITASLNEIVVSSVNKAVKSAVAGVQKKNKTGEEDHKAILFKCDRNDQKSRMNNIRIVGINEDQDENESVESMISKVRKVAEKAEVPLKQEDVADIYRVGRRQKNANGQETKHRAIHVALKSRIARDKMISGKPMLKQKK